MKEQAAEKIPARMSRKIKIILGLFFFLSALALIILCIWFGERYFFTENPRFIIRDIQFDCRSGYWAGKNEMEKQEKALAFARLAGIIPGKTNTFTLNLRKLRNRIRESEPEISDVTIRRELPDLIVFEVVSRIPCADTGRGFYLDNDGMVLLKERCPDLRGSLPLIASPTLKDALNRGEKVRSQDVLTALQIIHMITVSQDPKIRNIKIRRIVKFPNQDYMICELTYRDSQEVRKVMIPDKAMTPDEISHNIFRRLIDWLENKNDQILSLRYEGMGVSISQ